MRNGVGNWQFSVGTPQLRIFAEGMLIIIKASCYIADCQLKTAKFLMLIHGSKHICVPAHGLRPTRRKEQAGPLAECLL